MRVSVQIGVTTVSSGFRVDDPPELDPETLAALIEGRLDPARRAELLARLDVSQEDLQVLADASAGLGATSPAADGEVPRIGTASPRAASRLSPRAWGGLIGIAAVLLVGPLVLARWRAAVGARDGAALLVQGIPVGLPPGWDDHPWPTTRGAGTPLPATAARVRLGARMTDLSLALRGRDLAAARYATDAAALLDDIPAAGPVAAMYRDVARQAAVAPGAVQHTLQRANEAARRLPDAELIELGAWLEAARVAAADHDAAFFASEATHRALAGVQTSMRVPAVARAAVDGIVRDATSSPPRWDLVQGTATSVLAQLGG